MAIFVQPGKSAFDVIVDFLFHLWQYAKYQITQEIGAVADLGKCAWLISCCPVLASCTNAM